jgi:hypothetical protein
MQVNDEKTVCRTENIKLMRSPCSSLHQLVTRIRSYQCIRRVKASNGLEMATNDSIDEQRNTKETVRAFKSQKVDVFILLVEVY